MTPSRTTWDGAPISPEPPFGASVVVYRRGAGGVELLLLHRAHLGADYAGDWAWTPPAGARQPGETILECAARELAEETGLRAVLVPTPYGWREWAVYCGEVDADTPIRLDAEHDRYEWVPARRAAPMCSPRLVADYVRAIGAELDRTTGFA